MTVLRLERDEVVRAYRDVAQVYAHVPPHCLWRAWECAAYRRFRVDPPVLDVGCGDGSFFRLAWPGIRDVVGVDADASVADAAVRSGTYRAVHVAPADALPFAAASFESAVANCALEHMDRLHRALVSLHRCLRPGATFVASVITTLWQEWNPLVRLVDRIAGAETAREMAREYAAGQHHVHVLTPDDWCRRLDEAGFEVEVTVPIVTETVARAFLLLDHAWHLRVGEGSGELGVRLEAFFRALPSLADAGAKVLDGLLTAERDWTAGAGLVLCARRRP